MSASCGRPSNCFGNILQMVSFSFVEMPASSRRFVVPCETKLSPVSTAESSQDSRRRFGRSTRKKSTHGRPRICLCNRLLADQGFLRPILA